MDSDSEWTSVHWSSTWTETLVGRGRNESNQTGKFNLSLIVFFFLSLCLCVWFSACQYIYLSLLLCRSSYFSLCLSFCLLVFVCLSGFCVPICLPAYLLALAVCLFLFLLACLSVCLLVCVSFFCILHCVPVCLLVCPPVFLCDYLSCLSSFFLLACLSICRTDQDCTLLEALRVVADAFCFTDPISTCRAPDQVLSSVLYTNGSK